MGEGEGWQGGRIEVADVLALAADGDASGHDAGRVGDEHDAVAGSGKRA